MKKVAIITLTDNLNYGNRLQNYALAEKVKDYDLEVVTLWKRKNIIEKIKIYIKKLIAYFGGIISYRCREKNNIFKRQRRFEVFTNKFIKNEYYKKLNKISDDEIFKYIIGSDQIWSPLALKHYPISLCSFVKDKNKIISYAPSIGVSNVSDEYINMMSEAYGNFEYKNISVREDKGKEILEPIFKNTQIEVLVDPTMLLKSNDWDKIIEKPKNIDKNKKYILNYFLGELPEQRKKEIEKCAKENNCEIINILDKFADEYITNPSEFLYLEKNAFLICTDSFHSCVFALLYDVPFVVFDREDKMQNMSSRIENLISKFNLKNRRFVGKITEDNLNHDYTEAYKILEIERKKANEFLKKALDLK